MRFTKLFKILLITSLLCSSSYAHWGWVNIRNNTESKINKYLSKKKNNIFEKYKTKYGKKTEKQKTLRELAKNNKI